MMIDSLVRSRVLPVVASANMAKDHHGALSSLRDLDRLVPGEDVHADRRGEALSGRPGGVDLGGQRVERAALGGGDGAEGVPELRLERDAGAVAAERQRVLLGAAVQTVRS